MGKGTRFNAHKAHVDDYFTTKIWEFTMTCRACAKSKFVIRTNPKGRCFDYCDGIKKKCEEFDTVDAETLGVIDTEDGNNKIHKVTNNDGSCSSAPSKTVSAIDKLEQEQLGERKATAEKDAMEFLLNQNEKTMLDDGLSNSKLRDRYRSVRNAKKRRLGEASAKGLGMGIELYESNSADAKVARAAFNDNIRDGKSREAEKQKFASIRTSSIFSNVKSSGSVGLNRKQHSSSGTSRKKR